MFRCLRPKLVVPLGRTHKRRARRHETNVHRARRHPRIALGFGPAEDPVSALTRTTGSSTSPRRSLFYFQLVWWSSTSPWSSTYTGIWQSTLLLYQHPLSALLGEFPTLVPCQSIGLTLFSFLSRENCGQSIGLTAGPWSCQCHIRLWQCQWHYETVRNSVPQWPVLSDVWRWRRQTDLSRAGAARNLRLASQSLSRRCRRTVLMSQNCDNDTNHNLLNPVLIFSKKNVVEHNVTMCWEGVSISKDNTYRMFVVSLLPRSLYLSGTIQNVSSGPDIVSVSLDRIRKSSLSVLNLFCFLSDDLCAMHWTVCVFQCPKDDHFTNFQFCSQAHLWVKYYIPKSLVTDQVRLKH